MEKELRFNFQWHEINSDFDGRPHAFTKAFWEGQEREFALVLVDGWIRFCEVDKLQSGEWNSAIKESIPKLSNRVNVNPIFLKHVFQIALIQRDFGRVTHFTAFQPNVEGLDKRTDIHYQGTQWVFIGDAKRAVLKSYNNQLDFDVPIYLSIKNNSSSQWHNAMCKLVKNHDSKLGFCIWWNQLDHNERAWVLTGFSSATRS